ncbi:MAG: lectin like domain-containing protein [Lachnospira sp.]|nr:lectin like domain-containing protein [Lachnospira sp.]
MKNRKLYLGLIFVAIILTVAIITQLHKNDQGIVLGNVVLSESDYPEQWKTIIAHEMNEETTKLTVDGKTILFEEENVYICGDLDIMIPSNIVTDVFQCAFLQYEDNHIYLQKADKIVTIFPDINYVKIANQSIYMENPMAVKNDFVYINAKVFEQAFAYEYTWDSDTNTLALLDTNKNMTILPASFNYRSIGKLPEIKNQGSQSTCWAFASLSALESTLAPKENQTYSVDNMAGNNGYFGNQSDGGNYTRAMAYLLAWKGPVLEADDPYGDGIVNRNANVKKHVQEIQLIESKNLEAIKTAVFLYGGVESSLYTSMVNSKDTSMYYNRDTFAYCYVGTQNPNHDVVIIGWDDNYSKNNFNTELEADGAFICMNSWGSEFGDEGLFYVSYYDSKIGMHNAVYSGVEKESNYDHIYQSDLCGWVGQLGYEEETAYFSNVYQAERDEDVSAVGFYATGKNTSYEIYYVSDFEDENSFEEKKYIQSGTVKNAGYYTIDLKTPIQMEEEKKYAVVIKITTPNAVHPIAIEYKAGRDTKTVDISDGEGYISLTGKSWEHVEESKNCNLCLKMYTVNREVVEQ